jgi:tetraacyldisaccharide 4'-kinase
MNFLRTLSAPVTFLYWLVIVFRNKMYDLQLFHSRSFKIPIISVGNINVGGTGKSPAVEYLIKLLQNENTVATLSRGYGRKTSGYLEASALSSPEEIGDEPTQFKQKFNDVKVVVDEDRIRALEKLEYEVDVVIMDDAYQHRKVKAGLNILLFDYNKVFLNDWMLPMGNRREPISGLNRADIIMITKTPKIFSPMERRRVEAHLPNYTNIPVIYSYLKYSELKPLHNIYPEKLFDSLDKKTSVILLTGIADARLLINYLEFHKLKIIKHFDYPDHYNFSQKDLDKLKVEYDGIDGDNKIIITTEKDAMRLLHPKFENKLDNLPMYYLPIEADIQEKDKEWFDNRILNYVRSNKEYN